MRRVTNQPQAPTAWVVVQPRHGCSTYWYDAISQSEDSAISGCTLSTGASFFSCPIAATCRNYMELLHNTNMTWYQWNPFVNGKKRGRRRWGTHLRHGNPTAAASARLPNLWRSHMLSLPLQRNLIFLFSQATGKGLEVQGSFGPATPVQRWQS